MVNDRRRRTADEQLEQNLSGRMAGLKQSINTEDDSLDTYMRRADSESQETKKPRKQDNKVSLEQETKELTKGVQTKIPMSLYQRVVELKTISQATGRKELNTIDKIVTEALTRLLDSELKS